MNELIDYVNGYIGKKYDIEGNVYELIDFLPLSNTLYFQSVNDDSVAVRKFIDVDLDEYIRDNQEVTNMKNIDKYLFKDYWVRNWDKHILLVTLVGYDEKEDKVILDAGDGETEIRIPVDKFNFDESVKGDYWSD